MYDVGGRVVCPLAETFEGLALPSLAFASLEASYRNNTLKCSLSDSFFKFSGNQISQANEATIMALGLTLNHFSSSPLILLSGRNLSLLTVIIIIIIRFLINMQVQGQHPHQWAPVVLSYYVVPDKKTMSTRPGHLGLYVWMLISRLIGMNFLKHC